MSVTLKKDTWKIKDPNTGEYRDSTVFASTFAEDTADIVAEATAAIDAQETRAAGIVSGAQADIDTIAAAVQSMTQTGTDTTLTVSGAAADAKAVGDEISELKTAITQQIPNETMYGDVNEYQQGGMNTNTGANVSGNSAIRGIRYYNYSANGVLKAETKGNYYIRPFAWDIDGNFVGVLQTDGTITKGGTAANVQTFDFTKYNNYYFRLVIFNIVNGSYSNLTPSNANNVVYTFQADYSYALENTYKGQMEQKRFVNATYSRTNNIMRYVIGNTARLTFISRIPTEGTLTIRAGNYKYYYEICMGNDYNNTTPTGYTINEWTNADTTLSFRFPVIIAVIFANIDDTTDINQDAFNGKVIISGYAAKDDFKLTDKKLSVLGDSISSYEGYVPNGYLTYYPHGDIQIIDNMYWGYLKNNKGMKLEVINAYAGSCVGTKWQDETRISFIENERLTNLGNPDYIIVEGGTNDFGGNPLGDYPNGTYTNLYEFRTAYSYMLNQLKQLYPNARIICLSLMTMADYNNTTYPEKQTEIKQALATGASTSTLLEFNESIKTICTQYGVAFCDISDLINYYNTDEESYSVHPKAKVQERIALRLIPILNSLT